MPSPVFELGIEQGQGWGNPYKTCGRDFQNQGEIFHLVKILS